MLKFSENFEYPFLPGFQLIFFLKINKIESKRNIRKPISLLDGMAAFHASDPGSIPRWADFNIFQFS